MGLENLLRKAGKTAGRILGISAITLASLVSAGCPKQISKIFQPNAELSPNVRILSKEDYQRISSLKGNQIIFSKPVYYSVGDIIFVDAGNKTPDGLLRKIIKISDDRKAFDAEQATFEETIKRGSFEFEISPPSGQYELETEQGVSQEFHNSGSMNIDFHFNNVLLFDLDKNPSTKNDQLTLSGGAKLHSNSFLKCEIGKNQENILDELSFRNKIDVKTQLELKTPLSLGQLKEEKRIARYRFPSFIAGFIPGTPLPVRVRPQLDVYVGIKGSICQVETSVIQDFNFNAGIFYQQGEWTKKSDFSSSFEFSPPDIPSVLKFEAYVSPRLSFLIYGLIGPYGEAEAYLEFDVGQSSWEAKGGLRANLGINANIFSKNLEDYYITIADYSKLLAEGKLDEKERTAREVQTTRLRGNEKMLILSGLPFIKGYDIFTMNADGSDRKNLTNKPSDIFSPSWSPDGKEIIFGEGSMIKIINSDGSEKGYIEDTGVVYNASYSPNRKKIVFTSNNTYDNLEIRVIDLETSEITKLVEGNHPSFSPDGRKIVFDSYKGRDGIYVMNADGSNVQSLTVGLKDFSPRWSPDGRKIVFSSERDKDSEIYVMDADGSNEKRLTNNSAEDIYPCWSPDRKKIAFTSSRDSKKYSDYEIYVMNADGTNQTNVSNNKDEFDIVFDWKDFSEKTLGKPQLQVSQASRLEDYFFQGKELEGLKFTGIKDTNGRMYSNPHILTEREIADSQSKSGWPIHDVHRMGFALYSLPGEKEKELPPGIWISGPPDDYSLDEKVRLTQLVFEFYRERDNWEFLKEFEGFKKGDTSLAFVNKNISSIIMADDDALEAENVLVNSLMYYAKRIGGEFYPVDDSGQIDYYTNEIYKKLGIPLKESAKYLGEALEFQKKLYGMDEEQLKDVFYKEFNLESLLDERDKFYKNKGVGEDGFEKEILRVAKEAEMKFFYLFPNRQDIWEILLRDNRLGYEARILYDPEFRRGLLH